MHPSYYYRAHCCILVFDVTRKVTYQHLSDWYAELREYCPDIPCVLVANKIDVDYNVSARMVSMSFYRHTLFIVYQLLFPFVYFIITMPRPCLFASGDEEKFQICSQK
jgi:GTPase SAR1 family protein